jgi:hypothetical protein
MNRINYHATLFVPTKEDAEGVLHIIAGRDLPPLCGQDAMGEQHAPRNWRRSVLCPRCAQKYMRTTIDVLGWE